MPCVCSLQTPGKQAQPRDFAERPENTRDGLKAIVVILRPEFRLTYISIDLCSPPLHVKMIPTSLPFVGKTTLLYRTASPAAWRPRLSDGSSCILPALWKLPGNGRSLTDMQSLLYTDFLPLWQNETRTKEVHLHLQCSCKGASSWFLRSREQSKCLARFTLVSSG